ncbi:unnamed protein product [Sphagnum tenellum]
MAAPFELSGVGRIIACGRQGFLLTLVFRDYVHVAVHRLWVPRPCPGERSSTVSFLGGEMLRMSFANASDVDNCSKFGGAKTSKSGRIMFEVGGRRLTGFENVLTATRCFLGGARTGAAGSEFPVRSS